MWLGFVNDCGWGAQVRYWELNSSATNTDLFTPQLITGDTTGFNAANTIQMQALDIEAIRNFCYCDWNVTTSFGYRHALRDSQGAMNFIAQVDRPTIIGGQTALYSGASSSISKFEGDGLTFSLAGSRPTCYGIDLFWNMRGSCLWGNSYSSSSAAAAVGTPFGGANFTTGAVSGKSDDIWIGELQAGAQWSRCLPCSNARFFLRGAFEYQYWGSTSGQTFAEAGVFDSGVSGMYVSASSPESSINLVGFALSSGITW
ncbi:hypothetical protein [Blastopirellula marina]|uniref:hypothetical protein n=1 Tax=Blastopirellula marina TaxID=124 RepID=UPI001F34051D|nr:hypothetical protein [Blastopirellula marina]